MSDQGMSDREITYAAARRFQPVQLQQAPPIGPKRNPVIIGRR
jgi:hypothetical protein